MLRKSELFSDLPSNSCLQYRLIRAASKECFKVAREHCEDLWRTFKPHADEHFCLSFLYTFMNAGSKCIWLYRS